MSNDGTSPSPANIVFHPEELLLSSLVCEKFFMDKEILRIFENQVVLDAGCGTGFFSEKIAEVATKTYACDVSTDNVHACRRISGSPKLACLAADAQKMPFMSGTFDCVFANSMVEHLDNPETFFSEVWRILKPGGQLIMSVDIKPNISWPLYRLTFLFDKIIAPNHPMLHRKTALSDPQCPEFISPERLLAALGSRFTLLEKEKFAGLIFNFLHVCLVMINKLYQVVSGSNFSEAHYADHAGRLDRPIFRIYRKLLPYLRWMANPRLFTFDAIYYYVRLKKTFL